MATSDLIGGSKAISDPRLNLSGAQSGTILSMKVSYNWLKDYIDLEMTPDQLGECLMMLGLDLESTERLGDEFEDVVVGEVISKVGHPDADRLWVVGVDVRDEKLDIVCGAPNVDVGQKVPVATVGAKLPSGTSVDRRPIRGVESVGMICSEVELGLGEDAEGIMVLSDDAPVGAKLADALDLRDVVLDFEVTPNRPDSMGIIGVAREVGAATGKSLRMPCVKVNEGEEKTEDIVSVEISDVEGCPRYAARVIRGVKVESSALWMRRRLEAVGVRPINSVVDVTNYCLMEMGHPLHAFDLDMLSENKIVVKRAQKGEIFTTLDGVERKLDEDVLVIADGEKTVALAGIMGGLNSEVTDTTQGILLESAYFSSKVVRASARKVELSTEASQRFERGTDFEVPVRAIDRTAQLIAEVTGGRATKGVIDVYPKPIRRRSVPLRIGRANNILGTSIDGDRMKEILDSVGCKAKLEDGKIEATVPSFRPDITREIDLIEEVARVYGYNEIAEREVGGGKLGVEESDSERLTEKSRDVLCGLGLTEVVTVNLCNPHLLKAVESDVEPVLLSNPSSLDASALRTTLLVSLLDVAKRNMNYKMEAIRIFEIGRTFIPSSDRAKIEERKQIAGLFTGNWVSPSWTEGARSVDFFDLRGTVEAYVEAICGSQLEFRFRFRAEESPTYQKGLSACVMIDKEPLGSMGKLSSDVTALFDIDRDVFAFCLDFESLSGWMKRDTKFSPLMRYPAAERDLAFVIGEDVSTGDVLSAIRDVDKELVESVNLFDLYRGDQISEGKKSLAVALKFRSKEATLSESHADALFHRITQRLKEDFGAELRS